jgi:ABC-2 type transport system permease protein
MITKIRVIAVREYFAAVRTKGFIIGVILMPLLMGGGSVLQNFTQNIVDLTPRPVAVIDRTPGAQLFPAIQEAAARRNEIAIYDPKTKRQTKPRFEFTRIDPGDAATLDKTRLELSERIRRGDLFAIVEIGPDILTARPTTTPTTVPASPATLDLDTLAATQPTAGDVIYYSSNRPTYLDVREFIQQALQPRIIAARMQIPEQSLNSISGMLGTLVVPRGLASQDVDGRITFEPRKNEIVLIVMPLVLIMLMLIIVLVGASPLTTNIIEEKQLRIAEVLLGSVTPFQLMMGKLLGGVATSLTLGAIYILGALFVAAKVGVLHLVTPSLIVWFIVFTVVAALMYGSLFVVAGAAATNIKEAQALVTPMMLVVVLPMFLVGPMINEPHGLVAKIGTFFPLSAPMVTIMRLGVPPAMPWWHPVVAALESIGMTLLLIWIAGRVFRAGFLLVGRPASFKELIGWILRG